MKKINFSFSVTRWIGVVIKEIHELRRDKVSISMVLLTPLFQLIILGYAINMDPHNLPTALLNYDTERMSQIFVTEAQNTGYFSMIPVGAESLCAGGCHFYRDDP